MKILDITFKNLNSLLGSWHIDLTNEFFISDGIFVITGATGAGKSTIFDAICLALYGQTPRLGVIHGQTDDVMTKHTNECAACVVFENDKGKFSCYWHHAKNGNKFNSVYHEIAKLDENGAKCEICNKNVLTQVRKVTGMDFKRFVQAMLLAQGGFDEFLKAGKNDRAEILELITGSDIYSEISRRVFKRSKDESLKLDLIKKSLDEITENSDFKTEKDIKSKIETVNQKIALTEKNLTALENKSSALQNTKNILENINKIKNELAENEKAFKKLEADENNFAHEKIKLENALKAEKLSLDFQNLCSLRSNRIEKEAGIKKLLSDNENALSKINVLKNKLPDMLSKLPDDYEAVYAKLESMLNDFENTSNKISSLDKKIADTITKGKNFRAKFEAAVKNCDELNSVLSQRRAEHSENLNTLQKILDGMPTAIIINERNKLKDGEICPVCGSREHYIKPVHDKNLDSAEEIITQYEKLKIKSEKLRQQEISAEEDFNKAVKNLNDAKANYNACVQEYKQQKSERDENFANMNTIKKSMLEIFSKYNIPYEPALKNIRKDISQRHDEFLKLSQELDALNTKIKELEGGIATREKILISEKQSLENLLNSLSESENDFMTKLHKLNFADEEDFKRANLDKNELDRLKKLSRELEDRRNSLETIKRDREKNLKDAEKAGTINLDLNEVSTALQNCNQEIKNLNSENINLKRDFEELKKILTRFSKLSGEYSQALQSSENWSGLKKLIGSAQGDLFRVFAQRVTLDLLIKQANIQLTKMDSRYLLMRTPFTSDLSLSVIDSEQAGEIRTTENLSGGERFLVSLALALGLSQIAGSRVKVDSLFLDEGFGSLDENSLETALKALRTVKRDGRLIGIISHVKILQEKISLKIEVIKQNNGYSKLSGVCVEKLG